MKNSKAIFYPSTESEVPSYYDNAVKVLATIAVKYGVTGAELTKLQQCNANLVDAKYKSDAAQQNAKAMVKFKDEVYETSRLEFLREIKRIAGLANFDETDALALGIRREIIAPLAPSKATITSVTVSPDKVVLDWVKGKMDGVMISTSYDGINFFDLGFDLRSPFEDMRKNKVSGQPEMRFYRVRFIMDDVQVGAYSDVKSVTVMIG